MTDPLSKKQLEFIANAKSHWNLAHGSVRSGKTYGSLYAFMHAICKCPDSKIYMVGHSSETIFANAVRLIFEDEMFSIFKPFCAWFPGKRQLKFKDKTIQILGAKDEGAIGQFQGKTMSLIYCDEMTLYPESIIDMIDTRLSNPWSMGFGAMNPTYPSHKIKQWIDKAIEGDPNYYQLHFTLEDNPFVDEEYKNRIKNSTKGVFYKRNYLGLWCLAEGSIFDFFDKNVHVIKKPPPADYFIAGLDYGVSNAFACVLIGVSTGIRTQTGRRLWVQDEYYWNVEERGRQQINSEFANDIYEFLEPYGVKQLYIDPSALSMKLELLRYGLPVCDGDNDVFNGIEKMITEMGKGNLTVMHNCKHLIREIENYTWDRKKSLEGEDKPIKKADHLIDALRYCIYTHHVPQYQPYKHNPDEYRANRFDPTRR